MHQPPNVRVPSAGELYARSYGRTVTTCAVLFGVFFGSQLLNCGAMVFSDVSEDVSGAFRGRGDSAAVLSTAAAAVSLAVLPLSLVLPLLYSRIPVPPKQLPPWTTPEQVRAARALVDGGALSNDPWTDQVALAWADTLSRNAGFLSSPTLRLLPVVSCLLLLAMSVLSFAWGAQQGDPNQMTLQANGFACFGMALVLTPLQIRRVERAHRFRALHETAYAKTSR
ncbi:hypothetical protein CQJ94_13210 [Glycomyces fuscus]|nr:hypothetical protein CQJ94_13210 [Glycomyces fuscus]